MSPAILTPSATFKEPSTKAWFLLLSLLTTLLVVNHHLQPAPGVPPVLASRPAAAPRRVVLSSLAPQPRAVVTLAARATQ